jgi:hypothetical protein
VTNDEEQRVGRVGSGAGNSEVGSGRLRLLLHMRVCCNWKRSRILGKNERYWITIELGMYGRITLTVELWKENCQSEVFLIDTTA